MKKLMTLVVVAVFKLAGQQATGVEVTVRQGVQQVELVLRNITKKDITYFGGAVTAVLSDGTEKTIPVKIDFLPTYGHAKYMVDFKPYVPPRTLMAGETYIFDLGQYVYQKPQAGAVIYDDRSWWGDEAQVRSVFQSRKEMSDEYAQLLDAVREAKTAPNRDTRDKKYEELINTRTGFVSGRLKSYRLSENQYGGGLVSMMIRIDEAMKSLYREHSVMGEEVGK